MVSLDRISWTRRGEHPILVGERGETRSARQTMAEGGALFDVDYPAATVQGSGIKPMDERGDGTRPLYKWVVRRDTGDILGFHSGKYPESPNYGYLAETADFLFPESADSVTVFGRGERVALTQTISDPIDLGRGDQIQPQILWLTSMNGQWSTSVHSMQSRFFCTNQLVGNIPLMKVRHTLNHDAHLEVRRQILLDHMESTDAMTRMAKTLSDQEFANDEFKNLIKNLFPDPKPKMITTTDHLGQIVEIPQEISEHRWDLVLDKRRIVTERWDVELEKFGSDGGGTRWLAYNAVQGAEQHDLGEDMTKQKRHERSFLRAINSKTPVTDRALSLLAV